jgi:hypothetical protein
MLVWLASSAASAEEVTLVEALLLKGGLVCSDPTKVKQAIELTERGETPQSALQQVSGCGLVDRPQLVRVVAIGTFSTERSIYLLVRYDYLKAASQPRYGIFARKQVTSL